MVDVLTKEQRSRLMSRIRQLGTAPELVVRTTCREAGMRYTTRNRDLPGSPDLANRTRRWAIFVHGCFWHCHRGCKEASMPRTNVDFWRAKLGRNVERDREVQANLRKLRYSVLTVWECQTEDPLRLARAVQRFVRKVHAKPD